MINKIKTKAEVIFIRFMRGFVYGFFSSGLTIGVFTGSQWQELWHWFVLITLAGVSGGITGGMLSIDKYLRWQEKKGVEIDDLSSGTR